MVRFKFEYKITAAYLTIGILWISFSDKFLNSVNADIDLLAKLQTLKGWFYVLVTGTVFFVFLKRHLNKLRSTEEDLENHRRNLQELVKEKTKNLNKAMGELCAMNEELHATNEELYEKNDIINKQNAELSATLQHLKETQSQLLQSEKMASLGILTAGLAHEINNPLNFILGGYTGLESYFKEKSIDHKDVALLLKSIKAGIDRSTSIVSGLNQFSRNKDNYDESCNIHEIIENCILMLNYQLENRIEIIRNFTGEPFQVIGNVGKLHQVFINIILNSSQAIENSGSITISTKKSDKWLCVHITDTGSGISKENLPKITDPFFTTKDPGMGTGLGLSITFSIIQEHKGKLEFESDLNKGTTAKIKLPLKGVING